MKYKVYKLFINFEKEEKWLNEMAAKGMYLVDYTFGRYLFEEGVPGEYVYRLELLDNLPENAESRAYIKWMEELGIEAVASYFRWVHFRKKAADGPFDLFSDFGSRIKHYKKVATLLGILLGFNFAAAFLNTYLGITGSSTNLYISLCNWLIVITFTPLLITYLMNISKLKKEKLLYE